MDALTPEGIKTLLAALPSMPLTEQEGLLDDLEELARRREVELARTSFLAFCHRVYPGFKEGPHHRNMAKYLHDVCFGAENRVTVSMPPRFSKSETISYLFVAWYLGHHPTHHIIMVTHTADLSADFGRKVRNLIGSAVYREIFPDTVVASDKSAANNWATTLAGKYLAIGVGANVAGHGADLLIGDDLCVAPDSTVQTRQGPCRADMVTAGDEILGFEGWVRVQRAVRTWHFDTVRVGGTQMSSTHPVWTHNRGWQYAGQLRPTDVLQTISVWYKIKSSLWRLYAQGIRHAVGQIAPPRVQPLGIDEAAVQQSPCGQLHQLWSKRGTCGRVLGRLCTVFAGHGTGALSQTHPGPHPKQRRVLPGELSLGFAGSAAEQSHKRQALPVSGTAVVCTAAGANRRGGCAQHGAPAQENEAAGRGCRGVPERELGAAPRIAADFGWWRRFGAFVFSRCSQTFGTRRCGNSREATQADMGGGEVRQSIWGLLLGVRYAGGVIAAPGAKLVCLSVSGSNTFYVDGVLTHNCSEQAVLAGNSEAVFATAWNYVQAGPIQRLMPNGRIVLIATRWGRKDPIGRALQWAEQNPDSPQWTEIRFPAIMPSGKSLWPEQWPLEQLLSKRASMFPQFWAAQYMQEPTSEEGALIKREWWRLWENENPPKCELILQSWDTAHEEKSSADPSAVTTWGLFINEHEDNAMQVILLDAWSDRKEFPALKAFCKEYYDEWKPDILIIEKKAAGAPLIQEMRAMGIPVQEFTPSRGNDKRVRMNAVADMFASGMVWAPGHRWARTVIDQVAEFPNGENDDLADTVTQAMLRVRQGGFVQLKSDEKDSDEQVDAYRRPVNYY